MVRLSPALLLTLGLAACSELTSVDQLDVVRPSDLENRTGARALRAGAITRFATGYAGSIFSLVPLTTRVTDEFTATHATDAYDRRDIPEVNPTAGITGAFRLLAQARLDLLRAIEFMQRFDTASRDDIAELLSLLAYTELLFAEDFCSGVPVSSVAEAQPVYGVPLTTVEMLDTAVAHFDSALTYATAGAQSRHLAQVGRARALLQLGHFPEAADAAMPVPVGFSYEARFGSEQENRVWFEVVSSRSATVADREGGNGLDFLSADDPRVRTQLVGTGSDGRTPVFAPEKYLTRTSPVGLASGIEARLIEAEALLQAGDATGALAIINDLRAMESGLEPLSDAGSQKGREDQLFRERAFWLFATGHRLGDLRRLVRQYGRATESVFPSGPYRDGLTYGEEVTLDIHAFELSNPNFTGCFNRDP